MLLGVAQPDLGADHVLQRQALTNSNAVPCRIYLGGTVRTADKKGDTRDGYQDEENAYQQPRVLPRWTFQPWCTGT
ncbi:hypothetical protein GCM10007170_28670 [Arthrobacter liuii]|uniref:Uncharacterized protein n=1 Tax=Arthrobacter liuii TaxID=1476996 RepID=A0ABQ2AXJ4_9MICC|nr:hypothetical protein GCM10007170_28670 [Arthrobacter liuii]